MEKPRVYLAQFSTGSSINLLPLAAGQLYSRLRADQYLQDKIEVADILFQRPLTGEEFAQGLDEPWMIGFSCFLWNRVISYQCAAAVKRRFPRAMVALGGPAIPKELEEAGEFWREHPEVDVICLDEGEEVLAELCRRRLEGSDLEGLKGILFRREDGTIVHNGRTEIADLSNLPSPYLDGAFDRLLEGHAAHFSGAILETNRGCPYSCGYCTWGSLPSRRMREKSLETVRREIQWLGRNGINYVAMSDSNFGIADRDLEVARVLARAKAQYGSPTFVSVSWVKNSSRRVLAIADIFKEAGIGFRVTLSRQSLHQPALKAVNRINIDRQSFQEIKKTYRQRRLFSYTELILGLPLETRASYLEGLEKCLSNSVFDQLYIYPLFLFPNTQVASRESREVHGLRSREIPNRYTKSQEARPTEERVEIVTGSKSMPPEDWRHCFQIGYCALSLHDDRLAFFILRHLKETLGVGVVELVEHAGRLAREGRLGVLGRALATLESTARAVQEEGASHLVNAASFGGLPLDPPEGVFLEMLHEREGFFADLWRVVMDLLRVKGLAHDPHQLKDLFAFQEAVMAHPDGPRRARLSLAYNWPAHVAASFYLPAQPLRFDPQVYEVADPRPSGGDAAAFLDNHFKVRGVPAFNHLYDQDGGLVFPLFERPGQERERERAAHVG